VELPAIPRDTAFTINTGQIGTTFGVKLKVGEKAQWFGHFLNWRDLGSIHQIGVMRKKKQLWLLV
jgi:hypothetical protein